MIIRKFMMLWAQIGQMRILWSNRNKVFWPTTEEIICIMVLEQNSLRFHVKAKASTNFFKIQVTEVHQHSQVVRVLKLVHNLKEMPVWIQLMLPIQLKIDWLSSISNLDIKTLKKPDLAKDLYHQIKQTIKDQDKMTWV